MDRLSWILNPPKFSVSRSHFNPQTERFLSQFPHAKRVACGSSLKFCRIAEGSVDLYPRLAPTHEWDVAAGHAIVTAAGGTVLTPRAVPLAYGRFADDLRVSGFVAFGDPRAVKAILSQEDCIDPYQPKLADLGSKEFNWRN